MIPGGCTSKLQPLDVVINKHFKNHISNQFYELLVENKNRKEKQNELAEWIKGTWDNIQDVLV